MIKFRGGVILMTGVVHVVLEFNSRKTKGATVTETDPKVHGVFAVREHAEAKRKALLMKHYVKGYVAVLKQRILG
jgi:2,3-bisphosphoglycerate-independent phosphoglycerate mutase